MEQTSSSELHLPPIIMAEELVKFVILHPIRWPASISASILVMGWYRDSFFAEKIMAIQCQYNQRILRASSGKRTMARHNRSFIGACCLASSAFFLQSPHACPFTSYSLTIDAMQKRLVFPQNVHMHVLSGRNRGAMLTER
jgi:hypothetical protein